MNIWIIRATIMENQMEKKMENEMETGIIWGIIGVRGFPKLGVPCWGSYNKDYRILGSILGYPNLGNYHLCTSCAGAVLIFSASFR